VRLESRLRARRDAGRKLLVPYVTGGLGPDWLDVVRAVAAAGADAMEIGIPFSDPVMDGPTIQEASRRALAAGATPSGIVAEAGKLDVDVPLAVMTYTNPVGHLGFRRFAAPSSPTSRSTSSTAGATPPTPPEWRPSSSPRRPHPTTGCGPSAIGHAGSCTACR